MINLLIMLLCIACIVIGLFARLRINYMQNTREKIICCMVIAICFIVAGFIIYDYTEFWKLTEPAKTIKVSSIVNWLS